MIDSQHPAIDGQSNQVPNTADEGTQTEGTGLFASEDSPQDSGPSPLLAQDVVQPRLEDEEATAAETDLLLLDNCHGTSGEEGASSAANAPRPRGGRVQENCATEDLVTLPLFTLEQLARFCAQIVQESKELRPRVPDPERDGIARVTQGPQRTPSLDYLLQPRNNLFDLYSGIIIFPKEKAELMEEVWETVAPFKLQELSDENHYLLTRTEPILAQHRTIDDIHLIFRSSYDDEPDSREASAAIRVRHNVSVWEHCEPLENSTQTFNYGGEQPPQPFNCGVMVVLLECFQGGSQSIGSILRRCYQVRVLTKPHDSDPKTYLGHIWLVIVVLLVLNTTFDLGWIFDPDDPASGGRDSRAHVESIFTVRKSLEEVLGLRLPQLCRILHAKQPSVNDPTLEVSRGPDFRISDLNIESLRAIGGLSILWTPYLENHLRLDLENRTLYVLWHEKAVRGSYFAWFEEMLTSELPVEWLDAPKNVSLKTYDLNYEIRLSWAILFITDGVCTKKNIANYDQMPKPSWISGNGGDF